MGNGRRAFSMLAVALVYSTVVGAQTLPVAHWALDETAGTNASDESANAHDGTLTNMTDANWVPGVVSGTYGLDFDGVDQYVETSKTAADLNIDGDKSSTVAFWCYTRSFNNGAPFCVGAQAGNQMICLRTLPATDRWRLQYQEGWGDYDITLPGSLNSWVHFALVHDVDDGSFLYADGRLVAILRWRSTATATTGTFRLGEYNGTTPAYYDGILDDVYVYDAALTQSEIKDLITPAKPKAIMIKGCDLDEMDGVLGAGDRISILFAGDTNANFTGTQTGPQMDTLFPVTGAASWGTGSSYELSWPMPFVLAIDVTTIDNASIDIGDEITVSAPAILNPDEDSGSMSSTVRLVGDWGAGAMPATGEILREFYDGWINELFDVRTDAGNGTPTSVDENTILAGFYDASDNDYLDGFGTRLRGFVHPTADGDYTFYLASDDEGQLWLSNDHHPAGMTMIAEETGYNQYDFSDAPTSTPITLKGGSRYYVEVLHREGGAGDHLRVGWSTVPATPTEAVQAANISVWRDCPSVTAVVAYDPDNGDTALSDNDAFRITFDIDTNQSAAVVGTKTGAEMDALFALNNDHTFGGGSYVVSWPSPRTLLVLCQSVAGATFAIGDYLTPRPTAAIRSEGVTDGDACIDTVALSGDWGASLTAGLIAHWMLDETVAGPVVDSVGGNDGVNTNSAIDQDGKIGRAYAFNGTDTRVEVAAGVMPDVAAARTITGWAKANSLVQDQWCNVFGFCNTGWTDYTFFDVEVNGNCQYVLHGYNWQPVFMNVDLGWHFFAGTYDGASTAKLYVDGELVATSTTPGPLAIIDEIRIGMRNDDACFNGLVDDVRVYDAALTDSQIRAMYYDNAPGAVAAVADDPDNDDLVFGVGDTVTIVFETDMNQSTTTVGQRSGAELDGFFQLATTSWGSAAYAADVAWTDLRTLVITFVDITDTTIALGDVITVDPSAQIGDATGVYQNMTIVCPPLTGDWGQTIDETLIVHWEFDETAGTVAADSSGNDYDGTLSVSMTLPAASAAGQIGTGFVFDGVDQAVSRPSPEEIKGLDEFTVAAWVFPNDTDTEGNYGDSIVSQEAGGTGLELTWQYNAAGSRFGLMTYPVVMTWTPGSFSNGTWYYVVGMYDKVTGEARIYVDGVEQAAEPRTFVPSVTTILAVGSHLAGSRWFSGTIDDVKIYGRSVPELFVQASYQSMVVTITAPDADAHELPVPETGTFTVSRTARTISTAPAIDVTLDLTGTADDINGSVPDFTLAAGTGGALVYDAASGNWILTIDEFVASVDITVTPIDDLNLDAEEDETVIFTVLAGEAYTVGTPSEATVIIVDDDVPLAFTLTSPIDDAREVQLTDDLEWAQPTGTLATDYTITFSESPTFDTTFFSDTMGAPAATTTVTYSLSLVTGLTNNMHLYWSVTATNLAGDTDATNAPLGLWTPDTVPPKVISVTPASEMDIDDVITITLSEPVNLPALPDPMLTVTGPAGAVTGTWWVSASGTIVTFTPASDLTYATPYTVTILTTLSDFAPNQFDGNGDGTAGDDFVMIITTLDELTGIGLGEGCAPAGSRIPLGMLIAAAVAVLLVRRRAAGAVVRVVPVLLLGLCAVSCTSGPRTFAEADNAFIAPESVASLSLYDYGSSDNYYGAAKGGKSEAGADIKWAPRGGLVMFLGTETDVEPRVTLGAFARMLEDDTKRIELAFDLTPSFAEPGRTNIYTTITGDFVGFIGDGLLYWKAGGGLVLEKREDNNYMLGIIEGGIGLWLAVGEENAAVVNALIQIPLGDANPAAMFALTGGYEF